ncbi:UNVERIFIED_CONTAM: hypothetical protein Slati_0992800 [Sesamum latifolium]|uniref:Retrotransposon gag domain-containing protein n=1 Tax=Sesamum latifolium TaxID=2727402 RepID=A0AAW2XWF9_9LAMI
MGPRRGAGSQSSAARMPGQEPESPRRAASPSERAVEPEDENSRLRETVMNLEEKVSSLESEIAMLSSDLEDCRHVTQELASALGGSGVADMRREMEQMSIQIGLLQRAVSNGPAVAHDAGARLRIPEPKAYNGARDAKEVENFLFDIEQYFLAANVEDEARKVSTATMYLTGDAKLWWRTKYAEIQANQVRLDTWALLREAIREQFFPENVEYNARRALRKLEHSGSVRDYVKSFGADSFRSNSNRGGGDRKPYAQTGSQGSSVRNKPQENRQGAPQKSSGCFLCDGPHRYRDCPKKQLLNALATFTDKASPAKPVEPQASASGGKEDSATRAGKTAPALTGNHPEEEAQPRNPRKKGLMFVDVKIHGKPIRAMIDTGATHNYLASAEVERLGLVLEKGVGRVKAINSAAQPIAGVAKSVLIKVGPFEGKTNLSVVVMDDFKLILGLEFLRDTRTAFEKGCKRSEPSYLCTLRFDEIEEASGPIPGVVKKLLREFEDVMPDELPRKLPPKRTVDRDRVGAWHETSRQGTVSDVAT